MCLNKKVEMFLTVKHSSLTTLAKPMHVLKYWTWLNVFNNEERTSLLNHLVFITVVKSFAIRGPAAFFKVRAPR
jgi:hypothetical protein